jgi:hypothetical protein
MEARAPHVLGKSSNHWAAPSPGSFFNYRNDAKKTSPPEAEWGLEWL